MSSEAALAVGKLARAGGAGLLLACTTLAAAPITFNSALPVAKGAFVGRVQAVWTESQPDTSPLRRRRDSRALNSVLGYGVSPKLALFGALPVVDQRLRLTAADGAQRTRSASGVGDARLFARYTVLQRDSLGSTLRLAPFLGVELPTGADRRSDGQGTLPTAVQPGSGAVDVFGGMIGTWQTLDYQMDGQIAYQHNRQANGFDASDVLRADLSLQYRLWPQQLGTGLPGFVYGVLETNLLHRGRNRSQGRSDADSGGNTLLVSPGLQYVTRRWIVEAALQWPLINRPNGEALEPGPIVRGGFRVNF